MKIIENKFTSIPFDKDTNVRYSDLLTMIINRPLQSGVTTQDMRRDFKILDKLELKNDNIEFTDDEFNYIKSLLLEARYPLRHRDIVEFEDAINSID